MDYKWRWDIFLAPAVDGSGNYAQLLLSGLWVTLSTAVLAWMLALFVGTIVGVMRTLPSRLSRSVGRAYVELFRNIPLLVQIFLWYFVLPEVVPDALGAALKSSTHAAFFTAVFGLGLYTAARVAEQLRAGIGALSGGQRNASLALGMTLMQTYRHVLLPRAFVNMLPTLTSEGLGIIKNSSVALTIGLVELTAQARAMQEFTFQVFEAFTAATLLYFAINIFVVLMMRVVERKTAVPK
jgi:glutamate/aspartate transport system permease protein